MNTKRLTTIIISIAFALVVIFSCIGILSVRKISVDYAVSNERDIEKVQSLLDKNYVGKNLLFFNEQEIEESLKDYHYLEVLSVDKQFPNIINVSIKERREIYYVQYGDKVYVTTAQGFALNEYEKSDFSRQGERDKITLILNGVNIEEITLGSVIKTDNDALMQRVFDMAESVNLTDCIKNITIDKVASGADADYLYDYNVTFEAYTGVKICAEEVLVNGKEKVINAFKAYDEVLTDYQKTFGTIQSNKVTETGEYRVFYEQVLIFTVGEQKG